MSWLTLTTFSLCGSFVNFRRELGYEYDVVYYTILEVVDRWIKPPLLKQPKLNKYVLFTRDSVSRHIFSTVFRPSWILLRSLLNVKLYVSLRSVWTTFRWCCLLCYTRYNYFRSSVCKYNIGVRPLFKWEAAQVISFTFRISRNWNFERQNMAMLGV